MQYAAITAPLREMVTHEAVMHYGTMILSAGAHALEVVEEGAGEIASATVELFNTRSTLTAWSGLNSGSFTIMLQIGPGNPYGIANLVVYPGKW